MNAETHESPRGELVRQSEAKRKQAPQSGANACVSTQIQSQKNIPY